MSDEYIPWWIPADDPRRTGVLPPFPEDKAPEMKPSRSSRASGAAATVETDTKVKPV